MRSRGRRQSGARRSCDGVRRSGPWSRRVASRARAWRGRTPAPRLERPSRAAGDPLSFPSGGPVPPAGGRGLRFHSRGRLVPARVSRRSGLGLGVPPRGPRAPEAGSTGPREPPTTEPIFRASPRGPSSPGSPLQGLFEDLETEEFLKHREPLRSTRGPELLHLLLTDEGGVPESVVVEADDVADRPLFVRDCPLHRLSVPGDLEVRFFLRREAPGDFPALVSLAEGHADVSVRTAHVREFHALDVRPGRLAVQGERDGVQDRRFPGAGATCDDRVFLRKPERRDRLLEVSHESAHLDLLEDEPLRTGRRLQARDRGSLDFRLIPQERASLSTRRASTLIASRFGWSARTLST